MPHSNPQLSLIQMEQVLNLNETILSMLGNPIARREVLDVATQAIARLFNAGNCSLFAVSTNDLEMLDLIATKNFWCPKREVQLAIHGTSVTASVARDRRPARLNYEQLKANHWNSRSAKGHLGGRELVSFMAVPLLGPAATFLGLLKCENKLGHNNEPDGTLEFTAEELRMLELISKPVITAMQFRNESTVRDISDIADKLTRDVQDSGSWDQLLRSIIERTTHLVKADRGDFAWWSAKAGCLVYAAHFGEPKGVSLVGEKVREESFVRTAFYQEDSDFLLENDLSSSKVPYFDFDERTQSEFAVRVQLNGNPIGVLNVESFQKGYFDKERHLPMLRLLAQHASLAVQRVQRESLLRRALDPSDSPEQILQPILEGVFEACGYDGGILYRFDQLANCLRVAASKQATEVDAGKFDPKTFSHSLSSPSFAREAFAMKEDDPPLVSEDPATDPRVDKAALREWKIKGPLLGFPIYYANKAWGCLVLWTIKRPAPANRPTSRRLQEFTRLAGAKLAFSEAQNKLLSNERFYEGLAESSPLFVATKLQTKWGPQEALPEGVSREEPKFVFEWANKHFLEYLRKESIDDIRGKTDWDFFPPSDALGYYRGDKATLEGDPVSKKQERLQRPGERVKDDILVWKRAFTRGDSTLIQVLFWDRTKEERLEAETRALLEDLMHRVRGCFGHTSGILAGQFHRAENEAQRDVIRECQTRLEYMEVLVSSLYGRRRGLPVRMRDFLREVIDAVSHGFRPSQGEAKISTEVEIADVEFPESTALHCGLVVTEVVANAFRHGFSGFENGKVAVTLSERKDLKCWELEITDNGAGTKKLPPFPPDSVGLGLVQGLVEKQLHGVMQLTTGGNDPVRRGTRFVAHFEAAARDGKPWLTAPPRDSQRPTILLVEDQFVDAVCYERILRAENYFVLGRVATRAEAVKAVKDYSPRVVLMDIELGEDIYGGLEAAEEIRASSNVPIIFLTKHKRDDQKVRKAMKLGHCTALIKSCNIEDNLLVQVQQALLRGIHGRKIFVCYAHEDAALCEELLSHLKGLRNPEIEPWSDHRIKPGENWRQAIAQALEESIAAVILVSRHLINSEFVTTQELPALMRAASARGTKVFPVKLTACLTDDLGDMQFAGHTQKMPLAKLAEPKRQDIWAQIVEDIKVALASLPQK